MSLSILPTISASETVSGLSSTLKRYWAVDINTKRDALVWEEPVLPLAQPTFTEDGELYGYVVGYLNIVSSLGKILGDSSDIGDTGRFYMLDTAGRYLWAPEDQQDKLGSYADLPESIFRNPVHRVLRYRDARGLKSAPPNSRKSQYTLSHRYQ